MSSYFRELKENFQNAVKELDFCPYSSFVYGVLKRVQLICIDLFSLNSRFEFKKKMPLECCCGTNLHIKAMFYLSTMLRHNKNWMSLEDENQIEKHQIET